VAAHIDNNNPEMEDHDGEGLRRDHGTDRIVLVLDPEALRLQTRTTDHRTEETMIDPSSPYERFPTVVADRAVKGL
jgi:hypothetical protein